MTSIREHVRQLPYGKQKTLLYAAILVLSIGSVILGHHLHGQAAWLTSLALYALFGITYLVTRRRRR